jgi:hypothetical protein
MQKTERQEAQEVSTPAKEDLSLPTPRSLFTRQEPFQDLSFSSWIAVRSSEWEDLQFLEYRKSEASHEYSSVSLGFDTASNKSMCDFERRGVAKSFLPASKHHMERHFVSARKRDRANGPEQGVDRIPLARCPH